MAWRVQASTNYKIKEKKKRTDLWVKRAQPRLRAAAYVFASLGGVVAVILGIVAAISQNDDLGKGAFGAIGAIIVMLVAAHLKVTDHLVFNDKGVARKGRLYVYSAIRGVGCRNPHGATATLVSSDALVNFISSIAGGAGESAQRAGYLIYIVYGTKEVKLIYGLTELEAGVVYEEVLALFAKYGHHF